MPKTLTFKTGVIIIEYTYALEYMLSKIRITMDKLPYVPSIVVTSIYDGEHMTNSRHYRGEAIDLRSKNFNTKADKMLFAMNLKDELGPKFTVLFEHEGKLNEHFHVQVKKGLAFP